MKDYKNQFVNLNHLNEKWGIYKSDFFSKISHFSRSQQAIDKKKKFREILNQT